MEYLIVLVWIFGLSVLWLLAAPSAAQLFGRWPSLGAGFALPLALLSVGVVAYWVGQVAYGLPALLVGLLVLGLGSVLSSVDIRSARDVVLSKWSGSADADQPTPSRELTKFDTDAMNRRAVVETLGIFTLAFCFLLAIRAVDPAVVPRYGEKFLDFGLLQSLGRASSLPPEDMWFAGESVSYYYGGHLLADLLARLTGTPRRFAYNLALATFYATYVTGAFDLAGAIAVARGYNRRIASWVAALFVGIAGNAQTGVRLVLQSLPTSFQSLFAPLLQPHINVSLSKWLSTTHWGPNRSMWASSRVIPGTINEFPLFAFLNGDLHAHMIGPTFLLLTGAFCFELYRSTDVRRRAAILFGLVPVIGAFQAIVHTWAFLTVFGLAWLAVTLSPSRPRSLVTLPSTRFTDRVGKISPGSSSADRPERDETLPTAFDSVSNELSRLLVGTVLVGISATIGVVLASPFLFETAQSAGSREIALLAPSDRSSWGGLLVVHGAFLLALGAYSLGRIGDDRPGEVLIAFVVLAWVASITSLPALGLVGSLLLFSWIGVRSHRAGFESVLAAGGCGLVLIVELIYLNEQAGPGRMNTVFKTYSQVWAIWAPAAGIAIAGLLRPVDVSNVWPSLRLRRAVAVLAVGVVVVAAAGYPVVMVPNHFTAGQSDQTPTSAYSFGYPQNATIDGTAHVEQFHPDVATGVEFLDNQSGQATLLSAPGTGRYPSRGGFGHPPGAYNWQSNPASSLTGLPTVAGWSHEIGYRGVEAYVSRVRIVDRAFTNRSATVEVFREYDVRYVWVGTAERERYGQSIVQFGEIPSVEAVVVTDSVVVYRVDGNSSLGT